MGQLDQIGLKYQTDKASRHHDYLNYYEKRLSGYRSSEFVLFEFGVLGGASIRTWAEYFPKAKIVGVDFEPKDSSGYPSNVAIRIGDATDIMFLASLISEFGRPTIVVDDASHRWDHQIATLHYMFPFLRNLGTYVIEDIDTSFEGYGDTFVGYSQISSFDYVVKMVRFITSGGAFRTEKPYDLFIATVGQTIASIEFFRRTCLITKK